MVSLEKIEQALHRQFRVLELEKDPSFSRFIPMVYDLIGFDWRSFFEPDFTKRFNGLMIRGIGQVKTVFLAVFPAEEVLEAFLAEGEPGDLLFMHHPLLMECGDPRGDWGRGFVPIDPAYLEAVKAKGLSVYTCHIPMDTAEEIGTNAAIVEAFGATAVDRFCPEANGHVGVICDIPPRSTETLIERAIKIFGIPYVDFEGKRHERVERIAIIAGCGDVVAAMQEAESKGAAAYITGEIHCHIDNEYGHRKFQMMQEYAAVTGMSLIGVSHAASEYLVMRTQMTGWFEDNFRVRTRLLPQSKWWR